ncbi:MAG: hypothetical protein U5K27_00360 [Desulfotignum sp.]|nr:hypothetical protein [Desulfotignum sp.]
MPDDDCTVATCRLLFCIKNATKSYEHQDPAQTLMHGNHMFLRYLKYRHNPLSQAIIIKNKTVERLPAQGYPIPEIFQGLFIKDTDSIVGHLGDFMIEQKSLGFEIRKNLKFVLNNFK